jgi:hypothetical protein
MAKGVTTFSEKAPPPMKSSEPTITKGAAYLRSCLCSPGATKAQIWYRMPGAAMKRPTITATFIWTQKPSVSARKTRLWPLSRTGLAR